MGDGPPIADAELGTALLQAIPDVVAIVRRDGVVEYVRLPGQHLGLEAQRKLWQGADMRTMMAPDDASEWVERIERCVDTGEPQTGVYEPSLPGAQMVWEIRLVRYSDDRALALARDVTEEFRKDRERKAAVDLMHGVASRVPLVLFVHDLAAGKNLYINRGLAEMLGYSPEDGLGEAGVAEFMHPDDLKDLPAMLDQLTESADGETVLQVGRLRAKGGGYRWVRSQTQCFRRDSQGQPVEVLGILEDITERRLLADQASRTAKMEAVGQLAASIAHDFNNLLTAMSLNISYLDELLGRGKAGHREVEELSTTLSRASVMTKHLLSFSQRASQSQRPIELRSLVGELVPFLRLLTGPRITVRLLDEHLPVWVLGEPNQLEQVLIILASNACDAMPGGGRLDIALAQKQGKSVVRVSDSGPGIAKDLVGRIFE
ncbi:MAG: PAS domain-containing protein, partial [Deltaproteobacteria bacterium]|nr:PAS domain-containing protein [Deltaproteobacteria bacterium]